MPSPLYIDNTDVSVEEDAITVNGHRYEIRMVRGKMFLNGVYRTAIIDHSDHTITLCDEGSPHRLAWTVFWAAAELMAKAAA